MPKKPSKTGTNIAIVVALIGLAGTVITAVLSSPLLTKMFERPPTQTAAPTENGTMVFSEDFENDAASGFGFASDNWTIAKDQSNHVLMADSTSYTADQWTAASFGPANFSNGIIQFKLKYEHLGGFYTSFRLQQGRNYFIYLNGKEGLLSLAYNSKEQNWDATLFDNTPIYSFSYQAGVWYDIKIEARGAQVAVYVDGNKLLAGSDSRLQSGSLEFSMDNDTKVLLDDVKVWTFDQ